MKMIFHLTMMKIVAKMNIQIFLLLLLLITNVDLRPSTKDLDQPAGDLEWEAWLLIHDSTRSKSGNDETTLKRITPKSIFTVRPFSPDVLPPCAEGYRSDSMGRCVKFIKIDPNSHLEFLVDKLNTMSNEDDYDDIDEESSEIDSPTAGPLQFNIPFGESVESEENPNPPNSNDANPIAPSTNSNSNSNNSNNTTVNIIPLPKEMLRNLTSEIQKISASEHNETIMSLIGELMQNDQPNMTTLNTNSTTAAENNSTTANSNADDTETIIILFHPLASNSTKKHQNHTEENAVGTTTETENSTTTETDSTPTNTENTTKVVNEDTTNSVVINSNSNLYADDNFDIDDDEYRPNRLNGILLPYSGDYKASYFQRRYSTSTPNTNSKFRTHDSSNNLSALKSSMKENIKKINTSVLNSDSTKLNSAVTQLNSAANQNSTSVLKMKENNTMPIRNNNHNQESTTLKFMYNNHRNRDRNLFWSNVPVYAANVPTVSSSSLRNERINSKFSNRSPVLVQPSYNHRKTLYSDTLFNRRRWSNR